MPVAKKSQQNPCGTKILGFWLLDSKKNLQIDEKFPKGGFGCEKYRNSRKRLFFMFFCKFACNWSLHLHKMTEICCLFPDKML